jgi:hypothetical protein
MHGFGTYIWTSGQRYDGEWKVGFVPRISQNHTEYTALTIISRKAVLQGNLQCMYMFWANPTQ